jgi:hypothetical protein
MRFVPIKTKEQQTALMLHRIRQLLRDRSVPVSALLNQGTEDRAYEKYLAVLGSNFGAHKVSNGEYIFQLQSTVDRCKRPER